MHIFLRLFALRRYHSFTFSSTRFQIWRNRLLKLVCVNSWPLPTVALGYLFCVKARTDVWLDENVVEITQRFVFFQNTLQDHSTKIMGIGRTNSHRLATSFALQRHAHLGCHVCTALWPCVSLLCLFLYSSPPCSVYNQTSGFLVCRVLAIFYVLKVRQIPVQLFVCCLRSTLGGAPNVFRH